MCPPSLPDLVRRYDRPGPRYTGYPMPPVWREGFPPEEVEAACARADARTGEPLSLYVHVPFCRRRCAYCGCLGIASPRYAPVEGYLRALEAEAELWASRLPHRRGLLQLHWGGGTPTFLQVPELRRLFRLLTARFPLLPEAEASLEVDPTFLAPEQLPALRELGFTRVSLGVQDLDPRVQQLIGRGQTWEQTRAAAEQVHALGFEGLNLDLVYGLPGQTRESFRRSLEATLGLLPSRLAIYGFAYLPKLMPHQRRIPVETLPAPESRLELLLLATAFLEAEGYVAVGMDHFAREDDPLARAVREGRLQRNFMGYAVRAGSDALGLGPSAIGDLGGAYLQNAKQLAAWQRAVAEGRFAVAKGHTRSRDDEVRRWIIHRLMGSFALRWDELQAAWGLGREAFAEACAELEAEVPFGTVELRDEGIFITPTGRRFVRNLVFPFDAYLKRLGPGTAFSRTV
jgi:oxygen-independent coproporphyrinogen-3 oxidase